MARPTPQTLLDRAIARAPGGRNNAGFWLAQQLHANGYTESEAAEVMRQFADTVGGAGRGAYTQREALATLRAEYRRPAKAPWTDYSGASARSLRAQKARAAFPTAPPPPQEREPDPESAHRFLQEVKQALNLTGTPAEEYLALRGIPQSLARAARCAYAPSWGGIGPAVLFFITGADGKVVAAAGRAITPQPADRQKRTYGPKSQGAFLTPGALDSDPVALTEAPIDALTLARAGLPAIALCGTSGLPAWLIRRLGAPAPNTPTGHSRVVYLAFDNDPPGETAAARAGAQLLLARAVRLCPAGKDWNEDLTTIGLDALRRRIEALEAGVDGRRASSPLDRLEAPESPPDATEGHSAPPTPAADPEEIKSLADRIRASLAGRRLPIRIPAGEITNLELYAEAEARSAFSLSSFVSAAARARLAQLGIDVNALEIP